MNHETLSESTRNDGENPARRTQVMESPKTLPISYNEFLSKDGAPLLLETLKWCALSLHTTDIEPFYNWVYLELEWCGNILHLLDKAWDKLGGIVQH